MPAAPLRPFVVALLTALCASSHAQDFELRADASNRWMRGNMHTHSLWSDGDDFPEVIAQWYRDHDYQFLVFTDHNTLHHGEKWVAIDDKVLRQEMHDRLVRQFGADWPVTRDRKDGALEVKLKTFDETFNRVAIAQEFLLIQGEEVTDVFKRRPVHLCATNIRELHPPTGGDSVVDLMNRNLELARSIRERSGVSSLIHLNHPNFHFAITAEELMQIEHEQFFEVYNGHSGVDNRGDDTHPSTERMWDIINTWRLAKLQLPIMYGVATDDGHHYGQRKPGTGAQPGRGWVVVHGQSLTPVEIVTQMEVGAFYSSSGVELDAITWDGRTLHVDVAEQSGETYRIDFIGTRRNFDDQTRPADVPEVRQELTTRVYSPDVGTIFKSSDGPIGEYSCDGSELYVRAVVSSSTLHPNPSQSGEFERAWVQPVVPRAK